MPIAQHHLLSVGYLGSAFIYSNYSNQSHYDQNINADLALNPGGNLSCRLGNTLRLASEERNSEFSTSRQYLRNAPYFAATYKLADRWKLGGNYQLDTLEFARSIDRFNNYNQQTWGLPCTTGSCPRLRSWRNIPAGFLTFLTKATSIAASG